MLLAARNRLRPVDVLLATAFAGVACISLLWATPDVGERGPNAFQFVLAVAAGASTLLRRRTPLGALCGASVVVVVATLSSYPVGAIQYPVWFGLYTTLANARPRRHRAAAIVTAALTSLVYIVVHRRTSGFDVIVSISVLFAVAALAGEMTRTRRALAELDRTSRELQAARDAQLREHIALQERARLARELHDALGHAVNVIVIQAGVAGHVFDARPEFARTALGQIETIGKDALAELDAVLGLLRSDDDHLDGRSLPGLAGVDALCERIRATGRPVDLRIGEVALTPTRERAIYRVVQEALTNAARHSDDGAISVTIEPDRSRTTAVTTVRNPCRTSRPVAKGRGLSNMGERIGLESGVFNAAIVDGAFVVTATLPMAVRPARSTNGTTR